MTELALTKEEVIRLGEILKTKEAVLRHRLQHYRDLHEIGEATEKYARLYDKADTDFDNASYFIRLVDEYRKNFKK